MDITIMKMEYGHLDEVSALERTCFSMPWSREAFRKAIDSDNYEYLAAVSDGQIVGYAGMQVVLDEAEITNIAVDERFREMGIGSKLLEALEIVCRKRNVRYLHLEVRKSNDAAGRLYGRMGFQIDGIRRNFYQKPQEDAVLMTKIL